MSVPTIHYVETAARMCELAAKERDPKIKLKFLELAEKYDRLASYGGGHVESSIG